MQYFKHYSNMRHDLRIRKLINRHGIEGYGVYNIVIESITENLTTESPIPKLEETAEDIAMLYNNDTTKITEIICYLVKSNLLEFNEINNIILCSKVYKFLDTNQTRSPQIREMIKSYKKAVCLIESNKSQTVSDSLKTVSGSDETVSQKNDRTEKEHNIKEIKHKKGDETDYIFLLKNYWKEYFPDKALNEETYEKVMSQGKRIEILNSYSEDEIEQTVKNFSICVNDPEFKASFKQPHYFVEIMKKYLDDSMPFASMDFNKDHLSARQIHGLPEEKDNNFLTTYFKYYNQYYGLTQRPSDKDFQTIKELEIALNNDNEKFTQVVKLFFENEYYFNRNKSGKPSHYLKSLYSNLNIIVSDCEGFRVKKENEFDSGADFKQWKKDEAAGLHKPKEIILTEQEKADIAEADEYFKGVGK